MARRRRSYKFGRRECGVAPFRQALQNAGSMMMAKRCWQTFRTQLLLAKFVWVGLRSSKTHNEGTVRNSVCEAIMMEGKGASYGY